MSVSSLPEQFDLSRVIVRTFNTLRRNLPVFATLTLVLYGIPKLGAVVAEFITGEHSWFIDGFFSGTASIYHVIAGIGYFVLQASIVHGAAADLADRPVDIVACLRTGIRFFLPLLGLFIVVCIGVVIGMVALVVPGLILATMWMVAVPAEVVESPGIGDALRRSAYLTEGYRWPIFGVMVVFIVVSVVFGNSVSNVQEGMLGQIPLIGRIADYAVDITRTLFELIAGLIASVGVACLYFELRMVKEGATPDEMIEPLDRQTAAL